MSGGYCNCACRDCSGCDGECRALSVGDEVEGGHGEDHDTGTVVAVRGDMVEVAWRAGACRTWTEADSVRLV